MVEFRVWVHRLGIALEEEESWRFVHINVEHRNQGQAWGSCLVQDQGLSTAQACDDEAEVGWEEGKGGCNPSLGILLSVISRPMMLTVVKVMASLMTLVAMASTFASNTLQWPVCRWG